MPEIIIVKNEAEAGEIYGRCVADLIKAKPDAVLGLAHGRGHELVHAGPVVGDLEMRFEPFAQVVGGQHGVFRGLDETVLAQPENVGVGAQDHAEVAQESGHLAGGFLTAVSVFPHIALADTGAPADLELAIFILDHLRNRKVRDQFLADSDRA